MIPSNRDVLIYFSIKFNGDFNKIYDALRNREYSNLDGEEVMQVVQGVKSKAMTLLDPDYPDYLKRCYKPPFVLYYYGDISLLKDINKNIAVVGNRAMSPYGEQVTKHIVEGLIHEFNIVSGFARGIDTVSHRTAIESNGKTIAVLPSGIDYCYPLSNKKMYEEVKKNHLVISEYPGDMPPDKYNYYDRNRLIAFLARAVVVTEAKMHSGTSITVNYALSAGKDVCCVPASIFSNSLCNYLISTGAFIVQSGKEVIDYVTSQSERDRPEFDEIS